MAEGKIRADFVEIGNNFIRFTRRPRYTGISGRHLFYTVSSVRHALRTEKKNYL